VEQTKKAISSIEKAFSSDIAVFAFDNSSGHACKAKDALVMNYINLNPDHKQIVLYNTE
jgi:predicted naringenin-chalcone synthase